MTTEEQTIRKQTPAMQPTTQIYNLNEIELKTAVIVFMAKNKVHGVNLDEIGFSEIDGKTEAVIRHDLTPATDNK